MRRALTRGHLLSAFLAEESGVELTTHRASAAYGRSSPHSCAAKAPAQAAIRTAYPPFSGHGQGCRDGSASNGQHECRSFKACAWVPLPIEQPAYAISDELSSDGDKLPPGHTYHRCLIPESRSRLNSLCGVCVYIITRLSAASRCGQGGIGGDYVSLLQHSVAGHVARRMSHVSSSTAQAARRRIHQARRKRHSAGLTA